MDVRDLTMTPAATTDQPDNAIRRRGLLLAGTALILVPFGVSISIHTATAQQADQGRADFGFLSQFLSGHTELDASLGSALFKAFLSADSGFPQKLSQLRGFISQGAIAPENLQTALDEAKHPMAALPRQIVRAWYVGVVGAGESAECITYTNALMNVAVADVLQPPSYAHGSYGSWMSKPV